MEPTHPTPHSPRIEPVEPYDAKAARRAALLRAARDVFVSRGYHDAKVDDIVAAANVAKGTFYLYFDDKRSVFSELVDRVVANLGEAILRVDVDLPIEGQVRRNIRGVMQVLLADAALTRILLNFAPGLDSAFDQKLRSFYGGMKAQLEASLAEGQSLGIVASGDVRLYAAFTIGGLKEVLLDTAVAEPGSPLDADARDRMEDAVLRLLRGMFLRA